MEIEDLRNKEGQEVILPIMRENQNRTLRGFVRTVTERYVVLSKEPPGDEYRYSKNTVLFLNGHVNSRGQILRTD